MVYEGHEEASFKVHHVCITDAVLAIPIDWTHILEILFSTNHFNNPNYQFGIYSVLDSISLRFRSRSACFDSRQREDLSSELILQLNNPSLLDLPGVLLQVQREHAIDTSSLSHWCCRIANPEICWASDLEQLTALQKLLMLSSFIWFTKKM